MKKKQILSMVLAVLLIFGVIPVSKFNTTEIVKAKSTFDPNNINWTIPVKSKDNMISFDALKTPLKSKKEIRSLRPTITSSLSKQLGSRDVLTIKVEIFNEQAGDRILYIPFYNGISYEGMYLPSFDYNTELYYGDKFKISSYTITPGVISTSNNYGYRNGETVQTEEKYFSISYYNHGEFGHAEGHMVTFHLNVVDSDSHTLTFSKKSSVPIKPIQIVGGDLKVSGSYSAMTGSYTTSVVDSPWCPQTYHARQTVEPSACYSSMSGGTSYDSSGPSSSVYIMNNNSKTITVDGYDKNDKKIFTNSIASGQELSINTETAKIVVDGKKDGFAGNVDEATPYFPEDEAFEKAKQKAKDEINALEDLTKSEKDGFINQVDKVTKVEEIKPIVENAKAKDLENAKTKAKDIVKALPNLSKTEINGFNDRIDKAATKDEINKIVEDAKAKDKENADKKALDDAKNKAKDEIDNLPNLTPDEKDKFKKDVDNAVDKPAVDKVVEDAKAKDKENADKKALDDAKNKAKDEIDNLPNLTPDEKDNFKKDVDNAVDKPAVDKVVEDAKIKALEGKVKDLEKKVKDLTDELNAKNKEIENLNNKITELEEKIAALEGEKVKDKEAYEKNKAELEKQLQETKDNLAKKEEELGNVKTELEQVKKDLAAEKTKNENLEKQVTDLTDKLNKANEDLKKAKDRITELEKQLAAEQEKNKNLTEKVDNLTKEVESKTTEINNLNEKIKTLETQIAEQKAKGEADAKEIERLNKELEDLKKQLNDKDAEIDRLNKEIAALKETIKTLEGKNAELTDKVTRLEDEVKELKDKLESANNRIIELEKENDRLNTDLDAEKDKNKKLQEEIDRLKEEAKTSEKKAKELEEKIAELEKEKTESEKSIEKLTNEITEKQKEIDKLKEDLSKYPADEADKIKELEDKINELEKEKKELEDKLNEEKDKNNGNDDKIKDLENKLNEEKDKNKKAEEEKAKLEKELEEAKKNEKPAEDDLSKLIKELKDLLDKASDIKNPSRELSIVINKAYDVLFDKRSTEKDYRWAIYDLEKALREYRRPENYKLDVDKVTEDDRSITGRTENNWYVDVYNGSKLIASGYADKWGYFDIDVYKGSFEANDRLKVVATDPYNDRNYIEKRVSVEALRKPEKKVVEKPAERYIPKDGHNYTLNLDSYAIFPVGQSYYTLYNNGSVNNVAMDATTFISNNRTMVPLRYIAYTLGFNVEYNNFTREAIFTNLYNNTLTKKTLRINIDTGYIVDSNGQVYTTDTKPVLVNNRIYAPIANIARFFDASQSNVNDSINSTIEWDPINYLVYVYKNVR